MIYTVTFNPSIDYYVSVGELHTGSLNRTESELMMPGGKGINVSMMLKNLGTESTALGFVGGFTGNELIRMLNETGIKSDFVVMENAVSRINVKIGETEINGRGPAIGRKALSEFYHRLDGMNEEDVLVLSGAVPADMKETTYADIMQYLGDRNVRVIVDASGPLIRHTLASRPFLIKPNRVELEELFNIRLEGDEEIVEYAGKLQTAGARNVLISLDKEGAVLLTEDGKVFRQQAPEGKVVNSIGAGDSMIAGFISEYFCGSEDYRSALRMGVAAGSATAFTQGFADRETVREFARRLTLKS